MRPLHRDVTKTKIQKMTPAQRSGPDVYFSRVHVTQNFTYDYLQGMKKTWFVNYFNGVFFFYNVGFFTETAKPATWPLLESSK